MAQGKSGRLAGNTATNIIKLLAVCFMFCDHAGKMLFGNMVEMRLLGRIAFPLYCWCLVVGVNYTKSVPKYLIRLTAVGLISQTLYMVALNHTWREPNIFLTLILGVFALWGMRDKVLLSQIWAPILALIAAQLVGCDYGWRGVLLMILLWCVREQGAGIAAVMIPMCLFWGTTSNALVAPFGLDLSFVKQAPWNGLLSPWLRLQAMAILALPMILLPMHHNPKMPRWLGYGIYPLHLVLLIVLEGVMGAGGWQAVLDRAYNLVLYPVMQLIGLQ